jgi:hypothetical protein
MFNRISENMAVLKTLNSLTPESATLLIRQPDITKIAASFVTLCGDVDATISEWKYLPRSNWINLTDTEKFWIEVAKPTPQENLVTNIFHYLRLYDTMLNFVENLLENERGPMNGQDLTKTDYDPDHSLVLSRVSLIF